ncbi:MAG TPA: methyl-accepting chemotaxis protein [Candidatus Sulfotelmatobacter sp.]|nr:methyl-accepting chemotaxis protein [Candidatus Sulfotelmatobacter sp.]
MKRLSFRMKLIGGFGGLLLIMGIMGYVSYNSIGKLSDLTDQMTKQMVKKQYAVEIDGGLELQTSGTYGFVLSGKDEYLNRRNEGIGEFEDRLGKLRALLETEEGKELGSRIEASGKELRDLQAKAIELRRAGKGPEATGLILSDHSVDLRMNLEKSVDQVGGVIDKLEEAATQAHEQTESNILRLIEILPALGLIAGVAVAILIVRSVSRTLSQMVGAIQEIANNNLSIEDVQVTSHDEIGRAGLALNQMKNSLNEVIRSIADTAQHVASASEQLSAGSQQISANSEETSAQASVVATAAQQVSQNLQSVSTGAEEMTSTIQSIASNAHEAATIASKAVQTAQAANTTVGKLGESSAEIGEVIKVITAIARQTNLLALNATIEAARAGEAGKGFAVVANEVKELAKQTAKATDDIGQKITAIQTDTKSAVDAIGTIGSVIAQVNDISGTIATAVEEQSATTNEMTRNVADAAKGSGEITNNIAGVAEAARGTSTNAQESQKAANELAEMALQLRNLVEQFKLKSGEIHTNRGPGRESPKSMAAGAGR